MQSQFDGFRAVFTAALQTAAQFLPAGREDEDQNGIAKDLLDLDGTLIVNFQNDVRALRHALFEHFLGGAVAMAVHMGPFDKGIACHHGVKLLLGDKKVLPAVFFLTAGRSGGV